MSSEHHVDRKRGTKDARKQLALLREKWPVAFPAEPERVRPLAIGVAGEIASAMGWSLPYTLGVLARWKMAPAYCRAVLAQEHRVALDGSPAEAIDAKAKDLAAKSYAAGGARDRERSRKARGASAREFKACRKVTRDGRATARPSTGVAHAAKGVIGWMLVSHGAVMVDQRNETS